MKKMRIALMTDLLDVKTEREPFYRYLIYEWLKDPSLDITLVHAKPFPDQPIYKDERVHEIVLPRIELPFASRYVSFIRFCLTTKERYDIVHWFTPRIFPFFWLFPAKKFVVMTHGGGDILAPTDFRSWSRWIFNHTLIWFSARVHAFIAVSGFGNREIIYAYKVPPEKVHTIYNGMDKIYEREPSEAQTRAVLQKFGLEKNNYILFLGRFRLHKNVGNLVKAYILYREKNPEAKEKLALIGSSKNEYVRTFGALPDSPYVADIIFGGFAQVDELPSLYGGAFALSFVTLNEGFGMPILEAWACKTPVVTSNISAMPEVAGNAAIVVDPTKPEALAEALAMLRIKDVREKLIERGYKRSRFFTIERCAAATKALWERVLRGQKQMRYDEPPLGPETLPYEMPDQ